MQIPLFESKHIGERTGVDSVRNKLFTTRVEQPEQPGKVHREKPLEQPAAW